MGGDRDAADDEEVDVVLPEDAQQFERLESRRRYRSSGAAAIVESAELISAACATRSSTDSSW